MTGKAIDTEHYRKLERMYQAAPINQYFQPRMTIGPGTAEVRIMVRPDFHHAAGAAHGAMYFKALDDAAYFAVSSLVADVFVLTISYTTYIERPVVEGLVRCLGQVVMSSRNLFIAESRLLDDQDRELARGSGNFVKGRTALSPAIGYR